MKLFKKVMAAAALAALACSPAHAIDRIGWSKTRETMYVHGEFELGDAERLYTAIQANRQTLRGIIFNSPGGLVREGYLLSRLIEGKGYDTGVARGGMCASACFMPWAAGRNRYLYADSRIGIHSASAYNSLNGRFEDTASSLAMTTAVARVYRDLKVPPHLISMMVTTQMPDMYFLKQTDLQLMNAQFMN